MSSASIFLQMSKRGSITIPKPLRDSCGLRAGDTFTLLDLDGVFISSPRRSEIDAIADKIAAQWAEDGETLETMSEALREERDRHRN
jgi:AbrB family looped-hinge helix DNA binding protein